MHKVWLEITSDPQYAGAHHYHIVSLALQELQKELGTPERAELLRKLAEEMQQSREGRN
jgi:hypothetical protein